MAADAQLAVYRVVQESLTNTMKHARTDTHATVMLSFGLDALDLRIDDDGAGHPVAADWRPGRGTSGMRTRIHAVGGELRCGLHERTGWRVSARLPLETSDTSRSAASTVTGPARPPVTL
jgi:signal transduction histidine kinase